ncbi:MAG: hypothetical protein EZS28_038809 [Streblomastix strix]|uniref:Uncharacterized protein n=1 Tax=Streblomastix strix TaxID=222440 RepID=A0A5J4U7F9_9EUKA|nr:MAG: hypothetical protein EZS28_038809 [Streblomastix strix]
MGSGDGEFELEKDIGDIESSSSTQRIYKPIGIQLNNDRNRQYNSVFLISKSKSKISFEESDRFDLINRRRKWTDTINKTYRWKIEQRSGRAIKVIDGGGLFNKEGSIRGGFKDWQIWITVDLFAARNNAKHKRVIRKIIEENVQGIMIVLNWPGQVWWTQLKEITVREKELGESGMVSEMGSKMKKRNLKVPPGRILALEVNWDKMEQDYFETLQKHPDYQEMQLDLQQITGIEVGEDTPVRYQPFGNI